MGVPLATAIGLTAVLGLAVFRLGSPTLRAALLFLAGSTLGAALASSDRAAAFPAGPRWPAPGETVEGEWSGTVRGIAERTAEGERLLRLRVDGAAGGRGPMLELRVASSPPGPMAALDRLRSGDRVRVWCRVRSPRPQGNPGARDPYVVLGARGVDGVGSVKSARLVRRLTEGGASASRARDALRSRARRKLDRLFGSGGDRRALLGAMLLGERAGLGKPVRQRLRDAGLLHLVAISGLHVGILALLLHGLLARQGRLGRARPLLLLPALAIFCAVVGPRPSVVRAGLAAALFAVGRAGGRDGDGLNTLALLAALLVVARPEVVHDAGYQLSFAATAGILALASRLAPSLPVPGPAGAGIAVSAAAYLAAAPLAAGLFGHLAPVGLATNLVAVPLTGWILGSGWAALIFGDLPLLGPALVSSVAVSSDLLLGLADIAGSLVGGPLPVVAPGPWSASLYYLALLGGLGRGVAGRGSRALFGVALLCLHLGPPPRAPSALVVTVLDVGQGQAVALAGPGGCVLVDAGGGRRFDPGVSIVVPFLRRHCGRRLEALILSHDDLDHAGGAVAVLRELEVGRLWIGAGGHQGFRTRELIDLARSRGAVPRIANRGGTLREAGIPLHFLGPPPRTSCAGRNDGSLVVMAGRKPARILIPGDLERCGERELLTIRDSLRAEGLVLAHHGSRNSSGPELLRRVRPVVAVASAGDRNRFGHPHPEVLERLAGLGARVWRTDRDGQVRLSAGDRGWSVEAHLRSGDQSLEPDR